MSLDLMKPIFLKSMGKILIGMMLPCGFALGEAENRVLNLPAKVYSKKSVRVNSEQSGKITYVREVGSHFKAGDILVSIEDHYEKKHLKALKEQYAIVSEKAENQKKISNNYGILVNNSSVSEELRIEKEIDVLESRNEINKIKQDIIEITDIVTKKTVLAPFDGVVTKRSVTEFEVVSFGDPLITILNQHDSYVRVFVSASKVKKINLDTARLVIDNKPIGLQLDFVAPYINSKTNTVEISYKVDFREVLTGQSVVVQFHSSEK